MNVHKYNPDTEFADRIQEALFHYGLEEGDLGKLIGTNATDIIKIINYTRTLGLNRANKISSVFGMKYYEFGNPKITFLPHENLPKRTLDAIKERKKNGPSNITINTELDLPYHTMIALSKLDLKSEFTAKDILDKLPEEIKSQIEANRITVLFKTGSLKSYVEYANKKKGTQHIFKFISAESKIKMDKLSKKQEEARLLKRDEIS